MAWPGRPCQNIRHYLLAFAREGNLFIRGGLSGERRRTHSYPLPRNPTKLRPMAATEGAPMGPGAGQGHDRDMTGT